MTDVKVGREMDVLVAEKVMGWKKGDYTRKWMDGSQTIKDVWLIPGPEKYRLRCPSFSTKITAAWEVVDYMADKHNFNWMLQPGYATFQLSDNSRGGSAYGASVMEAICRAALKAMRT